LLAMLLGDGKGCSVDWRHALLLVASEVGGWVCINENELVNGGHTVHDKVSTIVTSNVHVE
jgi:hypothetical protein